MSGRATFPVGDHDADCESIERDANTYLARPAWQRLVLFRDALNLLRRVALRLSDRVFTPPVADHSTFYREHAERMRDLAMEACARNDSLQNAIDAMTIERGTDRVAVFVAEENIEAGSHVAVNPDTGMLRMARIAVTEDGG